MNLLRLFLSGGLLLGAGQSRAEDAPAFDLERLRFSDLQASAGPASRVLAAPGSPRSYQKIIDANENLAGIVERLDLSSAPVEVQEVLRGQAKALAKGTRRLPSFVRTARRVVAGGGLFARVAEKLFGGIGSAGPGKLMIDVLSSRITELVKPVPSLPVQENGRVLATASAPASAPPAASPAPAIPVLPPGTDPCTAFMMKLRMIEGKSYEPYSEVSLANLALTVSFNNYAAEIRQLVPEELFPLALGINDAAAQEGAKGIDPETMKSLQLLMDQARQQDFHRFDRSVGDLLKDAPEGFRRQAQEILAQAAYQRGGLE